MLKTSKSFESSLSDHHKSVSTIMKSGSFMGPPRNKIYRSYKNFDLECFNTSLKTKPNSIKGPTDEFDEGFCSVLNLHAPLKVKMLRHTNSAFLTKGLRKAIMKR